MSLFPNLDRQLVEDKGEILAAIHALYHAVMERFETIEERLDKMVNTMADIQAAVTAEDTVVDSAIALLQGLAAAVAALKPNQAAIDALAADITAKTSALSNAVVANTPAA